MLNDKIEAVRMVALSINKAELRSVDNLDRSIEVMTSVLAAKKRLNLDASFAVDALAEAASATYFYAQGLQAMVRSHRHLAADQVSLGVPPRAGGDFCPWPALQKEDDQRPPLAIVA